MFAERAAYMHVNRSKIASITLCISRLDSGMQRKPSDGFKHDEKATENKQRWNKEQEQTR